MNSALGKYVILCSDCMEFMKGTEAGVFDCVITDPPYAGFGMGASPEEYSNAFLPFVSEMLRCTKGEMNDKRIAISQPGRKMDLLNAKLPAMNFLRIQNAFEDGRGEDALFLIRNPLNMTDREAEHWAEIPATTHPNQRDVNKMAPLIKVMSKPGDIILDPFCGSGAIGLAAVLLGRNFVGVELMEERARDANSRFEALGAPRLAI